MAKKKVTELVADISAGFLEENGLELYHCEFVKEGRDWFLRVFIDKAGDGADEYVSTDDCELVSRFLSEKLDEADPVVQNYYLGVSSPGMDRTLYKPQDFARFAGKQVDVTLYKGMDGKKVFSGALKGLIDENVVITDENNNELKFPAEQVAKTCLAVVF